MLEGVKEPRHVAEYVVGVDGFVIPTKYLEDGKIVEANSLDLRGSIENMLELMREIRHSRLKVTEPKEKQ